jgi:hypothetical protein
MNRLAFAVLLTLSACTREPTFEERRQAAYDAESARLAAARYAPPPPPGFVVDVVPPPPQGYVLDTPRSEGQTVMDTAAAERLNAEMDRRFEASRVQEAQFQRLKEQREQTEALRRIESDVREIRDNVD